MPDYLWVRVDGQWYLRVCYPGGPYFILTRQQAAQLAATMPPWLTTHPPTAADN